MAPFRRPIRHYVVEAQGVSRRYLSVFSTYRELRAGDDAGDGAVVVSGPWDREREAYTDREGREAVEEVMSS